ncbi:hypothetical protein BC826DRAFT_1102007 [Russula brevipes]|nr:hypothetical protein BC826DRAFT_1102007 [Russula brevipes]
MAAPPSDLETHAIEDLTADEAGDLGLWIGTNRLYDSVPWYVSEALRQRTAPLPSVLDLVPSPHLPVLELLEFETPPLVKIDQDIPPVHIFSLREATHPSSECLRLTAPSTRHLSQLRAHAGQAMLDGKMSIQHWDNQDVFMPFDALGTWALILEVATAKIAWTKALQWMKKHQETIPERYASRIMSLLRQVPWKDSIKGLGSVLTITSMAAFLSEEWLSDAHIDAMLTVATCVRHGTLSHAVPCTEILSPDFPSHIFSSPLLATTPLTSVYLTKAPKHITKLATSLSNAAAGFRIATVAFSPPGHWACLLVDSQAGTICWGDSLGRAIPSGYEARLKAWLEFFVPQLRFLPLQRLPCAHQTDSYSCGIISVNTLKHHLFGDTLWTESRREILRIEEFLDIMDFSEGWRMRVSTSFLCADLIVSSTLQLSVPIVEHVPSASQTIQGLTESLPMSLSPSEGVGTPAAAKKKRARSLAYPCPDSGIRKRPKIDAPPGTSKQAVSKRKALDQIRNGTFIQDPKRWESFKAKLAQLDPAFEVCEGDVGRILSVKHSRCGSWIRMAAPYSIERFKTHVLKPCSFSTTAGGMKTLSSYGVIVLPMNASSSLSASSRKSSTACGPLPCPGLTEKNDRRITQYINRTSATSAGGIDVRVVAKDLFRDDYNNLSEKKKGLARQKQMQTHTWSVDRMRSSIHAIGTSACRGNAVLAIDGALGPCNQCLALLSQRAFRNAISREIPKNENRVYVPHTFQPAEVGKIYKFGLNELIDGTSSHSDSLTRFVRQVVAGNLDNKPVFLDLVQVLTNEAERRERGLGRQNTKYPPAFDEWCHELLCIRPEAYRSFRLQFAGRTDRNFLLKRSMSPGFTQGISSRTLERALKYLQDYRYPLNAPVSLSVDDTKLLPAFRPHFDGATKKWFLVGNTGYPLEVSDISTIETQIEHARGQLATKLRLWVLQIPLPHVPPHILAVMPLASTTDTATLVEMEQHLLHVLLSSETSLCIVSLGSDGSVLEREARRALVRNGTAETVLHTIPHPDSCESEPLKIPLMQVHGRYLVATQDPKHARKTGRNNLFSGARLLVLGNHTVCYEQIRHMASDKDTPLYWRDVNRLDRQDDRAAARLFSAAFLQHCIARHGHSNVALPIYLFVVGELIDAYENRQIPHIDRIKMALRMRFFKTIWKSFLRSAGYPENRYFISSAADDIIDILIDGLIGLIYIHRDYLDTTFPLLPWMHGSEGNEHVFGLLRSLISDFTMLDVLRLVPKLNVRLMAACRAKHSTTDFQRTAAGYCHTYFDAGNISLDVLSTFPSDHDIAQAASAAFDEANTLWDLLGYYRSNKLSIPTLPSTSVHDVDDPDDAIDDADTSGRRLLQEALDASAQLSGLDSSTRARLDEYSFAAACMSIADQEMITSLPEEDKESQQALMERVLEVLLDYENITENDRARVQDNITYIHSDVPSVMLPGNSSSSSPDLFSDLSSLIDTRFKHQSNEEARALTTAASQDSERRQLAIKISAIIRATNALPVGQTTGLNRRTRWSTTDKDSASLSTPVDSGATVTGNARNAQAASQKSAQIVVKRRATAFASLRNAECFGAAKISALFPLTNGCFGLAVVDSELIMVKVLTMYEKGLGKGANHAWTPSAMSIGSLSYIAVQCYEHARQRQFQPMECMATRTMRFTHLPSLAFLCVVPQTSIRQSLSTRFIELQQGQFNDIFQALLSEKDKVISAVHGLLKSSRKKQPETNKSDEDA